MMPTRDHVRMIIQSTCMIMQQRVAHRTDRAVRGTSPTGQTGAMLPGATPTKGRLLVATPPLDDPNFDRTVVYVLEHHDEGALGVVINRPTPEQLDEPLDRWVDLLVTAAAVFAGGPVEPDALIALAYTRQPIAASTDELSPVAGRVVSADLTVDPALVAGRARGAADLPRLRRLGSRPARAEIEAGAWLVLDPDRTTCSATSPRSCGATSCAARADASPGSPTPPTTSAPTD